MTAVWPLPDLLDHLRGLHEIWANEAADRLYEVTGRMDRFEREVVRLAGATSCAVCGSNDPSVRNTMPDIVAQRLFPDAVDIHVMACYWDEYHDPQHALAVFAEVEVEHDRQTAQLAAVVTALDAYDEDIKFEDRFEGELIKGRIAHDCVSAIAKAVGR